MKCLSVGLAVFLFLSLLGVSEGAEKSVTIRYTHELPVTHHNHIAAMKLAEEIHQRSKGGMTLKVFPAAQLFSDKESIKAIRGGAVEMGMIPVVYWVPYTPLTDILELPFLLPDYKAAYRAQDGMFGKTMGEEGEKIGIKILSWWDYGATYFTNKVRPIKKPEDFKGLRIRVYGGIVSDVVKLLGGAPAFLSGGEVYMALQRGTVDGAITGFTSYLERKYYEVVKYLLVAPVGYQTYTIMVNKGFWEGLPPDQQKIILDSLKLVTEGVRKNVEKINNDALKELVNKGMVTYTPTREERNEFVKATQSIQEDFIKKNGERAKMIIDDISKE